MRKAFITALLILTCPCTLFAGEFVVEKAMKGITLSGYTRSKTTVTVSAEVSGKVLRVNYDMGETIGKKPFYEIDPTFINFQVESTRQSLKKLKTAIKKSESHVSYLQKEFKRIDTLHKGDKATEVKRDSAKESLDQARLEHEQIKIEKAVLDTALRELNERKRRHGIFASKGWIVVEKSVEPGEIVAPGTSLARVSDYRDLVIPLFVSREEFAAIKEFPETFDAGLEGKPVKTKIHWINPEFNEKTRKLNIELILSGYEGERRGGLAFSLPRRIGMEGLLIPKDAVVSRYENPKVTVKGTEKTVNVMILGETNGAFIIADNPELPIGTELVKGSL